jgi:hypothetical protein
LRLKLLQQSDTSTKQANEYSAPSSGPGSATGGLLGYLASASSGKSNPYEEMLLREQQIRQQELLRSAEASASLYEKMNGLLGSSAQEFGGWAARIAADQYRGFGNVNGASSLGLNPSSAAPANLSDSQGSNSNPGLRAAESPAESETTKLLGSLTDQELCDLAQHGRLPARLSGARSQSSGQVEGQPTNE